MRLLALVLPVAVCAGLVSGAAVPASAAAPSRPAPLTAVTARPGPGVGQVTFTWRTTGAATTGYVVETGLTTFKVGDPTLPDHGRGARYFTATGKARSLTINAAGAGAAAGSANHLYYRVKAVNKTRAGSVERPWPYLQSVAVKPAPAAPRGATLRVATFNVRTNTPTPGVRPWLQRLPAVAATIAAHRPGVVAVQELNHTRADAKPLPGAGAERQNESLVRQLASHGLTYRLVRTTGYVGPGVASGSQGTRVLFDATRYRQLSSCPEETGRARWSASCTIALPLLPGDGEAQRRRAAYVLLQDRSSGKRFFVVSVHLDARHANTRAGDRRFEQLRAAQVRHVVGTMNRLNTAKVPVVLAGDLNTYQNHQFGYDAHDALVAGGYYDTAAAATQVNVRATTMNHFATQLAPSPSGWGSRLDVVTVKGVRGSLRWENVFKTVNSNRPSDHNMVVADIRLP